MALFVKIDLEAYKEKIKSQQRVLKHSLFFSDAEKELVNLCYEELTEICNNAIAIQPQIESAINTIIRNK